MLANQVEGLRGI